MATKCNVLNLPGMCVHYLEVLKAIQCKRFLCGSLCVFWDNPYIICILCVYIQYIRTHTCTCMYWHCHIVIYLWEEPMVRFDICASSACIVQIFVYMVYVCTCIYVVYACMYVCVCVCMCMCMLLGSTCSYMC